MPVRVIDCSPSAGAVAVKVTAEKYPQSIAGIVWQYRPDKTFDRTVGAFSTELPQLALGTPKQIDKYYFRVKGKVLELGDDPPTPYVVEVAVIQDGNVLYVESPDDGGKGTIGKESQDFDYRFQLRVQDGN